MENINNTHNSIHSFSCSSPVSILPGSNFHPQRAGINLQAIYLVSFPLDFLSFSTWQGHFFGLSHESHQACPSHNYWTCAPVQFLLLVRGLWYSPSPVPGLWGLTQCESPFFRWDSLYGGKVIISPLSCYSFPSPEHSHKNYPTVERLTIVSKISSVHNNR